MADTVCGRDDCSRDENGPISDRASSGGDDRRRVAVDAGRQRAGPDQVRRHGGRGHRDAGLRGRQRTGRQAAVRQLLRVRVPHPALHHRHLLREHPTSYHSSRDRL